MDKEKAKAYDKAIERARIWKDKSGMPKYKQGILDDIFPELAESEDERIRKAIISYIDYEALRGGEWFGVKVNDIIDWLEKQGEQKPANEEMIETLRTEYEKGRADVIVEIEKCYEKAITAEAQTYLIKDLLDRLKTKK